MPQKIRVLIAKVGLDGHDVGARVVASFLRDAGMEVIYTGLRQTPEKVVRAAIHEDVDLIGISILSGAHMALVSRVMELLSENGADDIMLICGGVIPKSDCEELKKRGVAEIFLSGTPINDILSFIKKHINI